MVVGACAPVRVGRCQATRRTIHKGCSFCYAHLYESRSTFGMRKARKVEVEVEVEVEGIYIYFLNEKG